MLFGQRDVLLKKHMLLLLNFDSLGDKKAVCHLWDETQGKRGSCEIAICLMKNSMSVCSPSNEIKEVTYYSGLNELNHIPYVNGGTVKTCD
jgi:hypothetical protein